MIGRNEQLNEIRAVIRAMANHVMDAPNVLFVTGEAGIGKTTLLRAALQECQYISPLPTTIHVECSTPLAGQDIGEVESLQPWEEIIRRLATGEQENKHQTKKLVADLAMAWVRCIPVVGDVLESVADTAQIVRDHSRSSGGAPVAAANQQQVFQQYINVLEKIAEASPLVLMIDDFHWADTSSTNLLFTAARQLHGRRVLFIVAYRPDDAASSRSGEGHPILHVRNELERYSLSKEVGVPRMSAEDLDGLLRERYVNYQNNDSFEEWLARISSGNALFVTQFLHTLEEDGYIERETGVIHPGYEKAHVPESAYAVVRERLRRLNEETRELLRYASVEGDTFTTTVLAQITEMPKLKLLQRLRLAQESHRVIVDLGKQRIYASETGAFRFSHALLHLAMYDSLGEEERELLHEAIFDVLKVEWEEAKEKSINLEGVAARLAVHAEVLGEHLFAAEVLMEGARATGKLYAHDETRRQLQGVLHQLDALSPDDSQQERARRLHAHVLEMYGELDSFAGHYQEAIERFREARAIFESIGAIDEVFGTMAGEADALRYVSRFQEGEQLARTLLEQAEKHGHNVGKAQAYNMLALMLQSVGHHREALQYLEKSVAIWEQVGDIRGHATGLNNVGLVKTMIGERDGVIEAFERAIELSHSAGSVPIEAMAVGNISVTLYQAGRYEEALGYLRQSQELYARIGDRAGAARTYANLGIIYVSLEQYDEALEELTQGLKVAREIGYDVLVARGLVNISNIYRERKEYQRALESCRESLAVAESIDSVDGRAMALAGIGIFSRELGDLATSHASLQDALELMRDLGMRDHEAQLHGELALTIEAESAKQTGEAQIALYTAAVEHLEECITTLRDLNPTESERWEKELERVRGVMNSALQI